MFVSKSVHSNHADLIHDVAYDYYGRRMATCSSDQTIKVWFFLIVFFLWIQMVISTIVWPLS